MPIKKSNPTTMTQDFNDRLERRIKDNPDQWLWTHKRWKHRNNVPIEFQ